MKETQHNITEVILWTLGAAALSLAAANSIKGLFINKECPYAMRPRIQNII